MVEVRLGASLAKARDLGLLVALVALVVFVSLRAPQFATASNVQRIMLDISLLLMVAAGQTMVMLTRNIDLSVGSILGLAGIVVGFYLKEHPETAVALILLMGAAVGLACGFSNGFLVTWGRVPAVIATLGTLTIYRGLVFIYSGGQQVNPQDIPRQLLMIARPGAGGVPLMVLVAIVVTGFVALVLRYSRTGRAMYAIGSHPAAARLRGLNAGGVVFLAYVVTGALSGIAGVLYAARFATVNPASAGTAFELQVIAATVIGGTSVMGGRGGVGGTLLGAIFLGTVANALAVTGVSGFWQRAIEGLIILMAVALDSKLRQVRIGGEIRRV